MSEATQEISPMRKWGSLVVMSLALAIIVIDTTLLNVSLSSIIRDLNTDIQKLQWVISAYSLTLAALTVTGGRLGDLFGRKRMFMVGAILFAVGSFIASISQNFPMLLAGESIIEGIGAALMMPATSALLVANFRGKERAIAFGVWGGIAAASSAIGPILGGFLTTHYSWRWGFRINIFVVILLLIGSVLINESEDDRAKSGLDWLGVLLSSLGLLSIVFGIIEASTYGWWRAKEVFSIGSNFNVDLGSLSIVPVFILIGVLILAGFVAWERRRESRGLMPLVSLHLFTNRQYISSATTTAVLMLGMAGTVFAIPTFLQGVRGLDAFHTGLALLPLSGTLLIVAPLAAFLTTKVPAKYIIQTGLFIAALSMLLTHQELTVDATSKSLIPGLMLFGLGMGLVMAQINNIALSAVPVQEAGEASGVLNTIRQLGSTLGSAIMGAVLLTTLSSGLNMRIQQSSVIPEPAKAAIIKRVTTESENFQLGGSQGEGSSQVSPAIHDEILTASHESLTEGNRRVLLYVSFFLFLGLLVSTQLPNKRSLERGGPAGH